MDGVAGGCHGAGMLDRSATVKRPDVGTLALDASSPRMPEQVTRSVTRSAVRPGEQDNMVYDLARDAGQPAAPCSAPPRIYRYARSMRSSGAMLRKIVRSTSEQCGANGGFLAHISQIQSRLQPTNAFLFRVLSAWLSGR